MASLDQFLLDLDDLDDELAGGADEEVQNEEGREEDDIDMVGEDMPKLTSGLLASGLLLKRAPRPLVSRDRYPDLAAVLPRQLDANLRVAACDASLWAAGCGVHAI